jgi:curved DNA-binding protein CbpA
MADPYATLGVPAGVSDAELRAAYRRLVQLHHPDHNGGSEESERRFEDVQEAYAAVQKLRRSGAGGARASAPTADPAVESRLADLERELREANAARERARQAAREAARRSEPRRATDEELGYIKTDDSLFKILSDAREELFGKVEEVRGGPVGKRVSDLIDELADKLTGER